MVRVWGSEGEISASPLPHSMSMKVPAIVSEAERSLASGFCVVVGLQTTGEVGACVHLCPADQ